MAEHEGNGGAAGTVVTQEPPFHHDPVSLRPDAGGVVRVGKSRVALDVIVAGYDDGMDPEDLVRAYPTLELADVYGAIAFYLRHRSEVRHYIARRRDEAASLRAQIEADQPPCPSKEDLLARRRERDHAEAGQ